MPVYVWLFIVHAVHSFIRIQPAFNAIYDEQKGAIEKLIQQAFQLMACVAVNMGIVADEDEGGV